MYKILEVLCTRSSEGCTNKMWCTVHLKDSRGNLHMKKLLLTVLAVFAVTSAAAQEAFPDIPAGHWAGEAVSRIADLGIVIGFPDGTFRGNESFTRYQAALVVSRLLDVIQEDMDAMQAMTDADLEALRNALQELASDVAAQGVRLNAVEGTVASLSDDVTSNSARLDALEGSDTSGLQDQIDAARQAADTAAAQAAAAEELARSADARSRQNADDIATIEQLLAELNEMMENLPTDTAAGLADQVERNTNDIANIREFVILLRRDQVAVRDRVAALEASDADQNARLDDIEARLTAVEEDLLVVSGSITLDYEVGRLSGDEIGFDVDRIFGLNNERDMGPSIFGDNAEDINDDDDETDDGEEAQERTDITQEDGDIEADVELNIGFNTSRGGAGDPNQMNTFETVITLTLERADNLCPEDETIETGVDNDGDGENDETIITCDTDGDGDSQVFEGYVFTLDDFSASFDPIGAEPLTFQYGEDIDAELTPYILDFDDGLVVDNRLDGGDNDGNDIDVGDIDGFVATVGTPDFLAFLNPTLQIVYGSPDGTDDATYYRAIRGELTPLTGEFFSATGGVTFAQRAENASENADALEDNVTTTVYGLDGQIGVSIFDIDFAYASSSTSNLGDAVDNPDFDDNIADAPADYDGEDLDSNLLYVQLNADGESIPVLSSLSANYRDIPAVWAGFADDDNYVFDLDQAGFAVEAGLSLFIVDLTAYFDTYTTTAPDADILAFGADASVELFRAISVTGFFHQVSDDGDTIDSTEDLEVEIEGEDYNAERDDNDYDTGFGVGVVHDGAADNALIAGLNLELAYEQLGEGFDETHILASADYELAISILRLTPYASFESFNDDDADSDDTTEIKVGTGIATDALDVFLQPSLVGAVNYRTNEHTDVEDADDYTAEEFQYSVGIVLNEFLFENSMLTAKYGSYSGTNVSLVTTGDDGDDGDDTSTDIDGDDVNNGATQTTTGYEIVWNYFDLELGYGAYTNEISGKTAAAAEGEADDRNTGGQFFTISYTVNF